MYLFAWCALVENYAGFLLETQKKDASSCKVVEVNSSTEGGRERER